MKPRKLENFCSNKTFCFSYGIQINIYTALYVGNYGSRSERLDLESNCILVLAPKQGLQNEASGRKDASWLQHEFSNEWNSFLHHSRPVHDNGVEKKTDKNLFSSWLMKHVVFRAVRIFL